MLRILMVAALLLTFAPALAPTAAADTCAFADPRLDSAGCGAILYAVCLAGGAPKETGERLTGCDSSLFD